jgi:hypothetical protein
MELFEELRGLIVRLHEDNVPYALCGGLGLAVYGIIRATEDIDLVIPQRSLALFRAAAEKVGFQLDPRPLAFCEGGVQIDRFVKTVEEDFVVLAQDDIRRLQQLTDEA